MKKQALKALEDAAETVEFAEKLFSVSYAKQPVDHELNNKEIFFTETEMFIVYCVYDSDGFDIILSMDKPTVEGDTSAIRGVLL